MGGCGIGRFDLRSPVLSSQWMDVRGQRPREKARCKRGGPGAAPPASADSHCNTHTNGSLPTDPSLGTSRSIHSRADNGEQSRADQSRRQRQSADSQQTTDSRAESRQQRAGAILLLGGECLLDLHKCRPLIVVAPPDATQRLLLPLLLLLLLIQELLANARNIRGGGGGGGQGDVCWACSVCHGIDRGAL